MRTGADMTWSLVLGSLRGGRGGIALAISWRTSPKRGGEKAAVTHLIFTSRVYSALGPVSLVLNVGQMSPLRSIVAVKARESSAPTAYEAAADGRGRRCEG